MSDNQLKTVAAAALLVGWFALVLTGKAPAPQFIDTLRDVLVGIGVYHVATPKP